MDSRIFATPFDQWAFSKLKCSLPLKGRVVTRCPCAGQRQVCAPRRTAKPALAPCCLAPSPALRHFLLAAEVSNQFSWSRQRTGMCHGLPWGPVHWGPARALALSGRLSKTVRVIQVVLPSPTLPPQWEGISSWYYLGFWMPQIAYSHLIEEGSLTWYVQWMQGNNEWLNQLGGQNQFEIHVTKKPQLESRLGDTLKWRGERAKF